MKNIFLNLILLSTSLISCAQSNKNKMNDKPITQIKIENGLQVATFANGCFWCTEAIFQQLEGVEKVTSGYSGGYIANPTYEEVCGKKTGHAECLQIIFDPKKITFDELLEVFWKTHDPTTLNQQGADIGPQYRSVVFYHNAEQKEKAEKYIKLLDQEKAFDKPIVTAVESFTNFYSAEDYHQNYFNNNGETNGYCRIVIRPKVEKFEKIFKNKLKKH